MATYTTLLLSPPPPPAPPSLLPPVPAVIPATLPATALLFPPPRQPAPQPPPLAQLQQHANVLRSQLLDIAAAASAVQEHSSSAWLEDVTDDEEESANDEPITVTKQATALSEASSSSTSAQPLLMAPIDDGQSRRRIVRIVTEWIKENYQLNKESCIPRSALYDHFVGTPFAKECEQMNAASFGKIVRTIFPNMRTRRLGTRGNSKYHYYGIQRVGAGSSDDEPSQQRPLLQAQQPPLFVSSSASLVKSAPASFGNGDANSRDYVRAPKRVRDDSIQSPTTVEMPDQVTQVFIRNYSNHSNRLTEALLSLNIESVQQTLTEFWTSIPIYLYSQMDHNEAAITIGRLDERIYSTVVNSWIPDPVKPFNPDLLVNLKQFANNVVALTGASLDQQAPVPLRNAKMAMAQQFLMNVSRRLVLVNLCSSVNELLSSEQTLESIRTDLQAVDLGVVLELPYIDSAAFPSMVKSFLENVITIKTTSDWAKYLDGAFLQFVDVGAAQPQEVFDAAIERFLLRFSYIGNLVMRDLTLRATTAFGACHLLRLFLEEYLIYSIENKWKPLRSTMQTTLQSDASTLALINRYNVVTQLASSSASKGYSIGPNTL